LDENRYYHSCGFAGFLLDAYGGVGMDSSGLILGLGSKCFLGAVEEIYRHAGRAYLVGGSVRDMFLLKRSKDYDVEVFLLSAGLLVDILQGYGKVDLVGKSFGVIKFKPNDADLDFDISLPRREKKNGSGHKGFDIDVDPYMSFHEAASRRDFTMNAMGIELSKWYLEDPFNGLVDVHSGVLRAVGPRFAEDPLRVLRGMQFAARFGMKGEEKTFELCRSLLPQAADLPKERIWGEWEKWATKGVRPSLGLEFLEKCGWISIYHQVAALRNWPQDPKWHPEGDVMNHTMQVVDEAARICDEQSISGEDRAVIVMAGLCHDFGKIFTTKTTNDGRIVSPGHAGESVVCTKGFLYHLGAQEAFINRVCPLVACHMDHLSMPKPNDAQIRRLAKRLEPSSIADLSIIVLSDCAGRTIERDCKSKEWVDKALDSATRLGTVRCGPKPIILGRHLIALGWQPRPQFGIILKKCYESQLDGVFSNEEDGVEFLKTII
jgi:tRNA nucleotidyltransferase (CCA-adding enzyme)